MGWLRSGKNGSGTVWFIKDQVARLNVQCRSKLSHGWHLRFTAVL